MRAHGVRSHAIQNVSRGFWLIRRPAVVPVCALAIQFARIMRAHGYAVPADEVGLAYAIHLRLLTSDSSAAH